MFNTKNATLYQPFWFLVGTLPNNHVFINHVLNPKKEAFDYRQILKSKQLTMPYFGIFWHFLHAKWLTEGLKCSLKVN